MGDQADRDEFRLRSPQAAVGRRGSLGSGFGFARRRRRSPNAETRNPNQARNPKPESSWRSAVNERVEEIGYQKSEIRSQRSKGRWRSASVFADLRPLTSAPHRRATRRGCASPSISALRLGSGRFEWLSMCLSRHFGFKPARWLLIPPSRVPHTSANARNGPSVARHLSHPAAVGIGLTVATACFRFCSA
jgi:hypothetical protein